MNKILPLLWVTTFVWLASTGPVPQRYRRPNYGTKFLNAVNTRSRIITTTRPTTSQPPSPPEPATRRTTKNLEPILFDVKLIPTPTTEPVVVRGRGTFSPDAKNAFKPPTDLKESAPSPPLDDILNYNYDYDYLTLLYDLEYLDFSNDTSVDPGGKQESVIQESFRQGKLLNNELFSKPKTITDQKRELIKELIHQAESIGGKRPKLKIPRPFRYTTPSPDLKKNALKESLRSKLSTTTPTTTTNTLTTPPPIDRKQNLEPSEATNPTNEKVNNSTASSNSSSTDPNLKNGWTAESSVSVEVRVESSNSKGYKIPHHYFVTISSLPLEQTAANKKNVQTIQNTKNNMRLREVLELEVSATPKVVDLRPGVTSTEQINTTPEITTTSPTTVIDVKESVETTTKRSRVTTKPTPVSPSTVKVSMTEADLTPEALPTSLKTTSKPTSLRRKIINTPTSPVATRANISQRRPSVNPRSKPLSSRPRTNRRRRPPSLLHLRNITSQLGVNPHGLHPSGITPFGVHPQGIFPFGLSPYGPSPLGNNKTRVGNVSVPSVATPSNISATKENQTANSTNLADEIKEERYHVQVKKPDGSINGDYVVLDPNTGSLSGVRYEAIDGADQDLIQQALLSFLSLDPRLDPRPKPTETSLPSPSPSSSSVPLRRGGARNRKPLESSRTDRRGQRPKRRAGLIEEERIKDGT